MESGASSSRATSDEEELAFPTARAPRPGTRWRLAAGSASLAARSAKQAERFVPTEAAEKPQAADDADADIPKVAAEAADEEPPLHGGEFADDDGEVGTTASETERPQVTPLSKLHAALRAAAMLRTIPGRPSLTLHADASVANIGVSFACLPPVEELLVRRVKRGSWAERNGVHCNMVVVAVNAYPIAELSSAEFVACMRDRPLDITFEEVELEAFDEESVAERPAESWRSVLQRAAAILTPRRPRGDNDVEFDSVSDGSEISEVLTLEPSEAVFEPPTRSTSWRNVVVGMLPRMAAAALFNPGTSVDPPDAAVLPSRRHAIAPGLGLSMARVDEEAEFEQEEQEDEEAEERSEAGTNDSDEAFDIIAGSGVERLGFHVGRLPPAAWLQVKVVQPGTWAAEQDLRPGDFIVAVNGLDLDDVTREQFLEMMATRPLRITVVEARDEAAAQEPPASEAGPLEAVAECPTEELEAWLPVGHETPPALQKLTLEALGDVKGRGSSTAAETDGAATAEAPPALHELTLAVPAGAKACSSSSSSVASNAAAETDGEALEDSHADVASLPRSPASPGRLQAHPEQVCECFQLDVDDNDNSGSRVSRSSICNMYDALGRPIERRSIAEPVKAEVQLDVDDNDNDDDGGQVSRSSICNIYDALGQSIDSRSTAEPLKAQEVCGDDESFKKFLCGPGDIHHISSLEVKAVTALTAGNDRRPDTNEEDVSDSSPRQAAPYVGVSSFDEEESY